MRKLLLVLPALAAGLVSTAVEAQTSAEATATIDIPQVLYLEISDTSINFPQPTAADFNATAVQAATQTVITHRGNLQHSVRIAAGTEYMDGGEGSKPSSHLKWRAAGPSFMGLSTTAADVVTNAPRGAYNEARTISYEMDLNYATDAPAGYTLDVIFTILAT